MLPEDQKRQGLILSISISLVASVSAIILVTLFVMPETYVLVTDCHIQNEGDNVAAMECLKALCTFDVSTCSTPCPLGFETDDKRCQISCECSSDGVFEGDLRYNPTSIVQILKDYGYTSGSDFVQDSVDSHQAQKIPLWGNKTDDGRHRIPYVLGNNLSTSAITAIELVAKNLSAISCIDLVADNTENDFVKFVGRMGCWSGIGKVDENQEISIGVGCDNESLVYHEIMHLLGFYHEQSRSDRDAYVKILFDNVREGFQAAFSKRTQKSFSDFDLEYDVTSIIHFSGYDFSKDGQPTILDLSTNAPVPAEKAYPSHQDILKLKDLYGCVEETASAIWSEWGNWSICDETCGTGELSRFRDCQDMDGESAAGCEGENVERKSCENKPCPGEWGEWTDFGSCSAECDTGIKWRNRTCSLPRMCEGKASESAECNTKECPSRRLFSAKAAKTKPNLCENKERVSWVLGDFHGNGKVESLCKGTDNAYKLSEAKEDNGFESVLWEGSLPGCDSGLKYAGDFNADGKHDLLCKDPVKRRLGVKFTGSGGKFSDSISDAGSFCAEKEDTVLLVDSNGDGKFDILCQKKESGVIIRHNSYSP